MYKKENKRSLKSPLYLQSRSKKNKKSLLFSTTSMPFLKITNGKMLKIIFRTTETLHQVSAHSGRYRV